jgi:serine/threonine protein kinase
MQNSQTLSSLSGNIGFNRRILKVKSKIGEGGFSFVYLVTEIHQDSPTNQMDDFNSHREGASYCLKATTVQTAEQKRITEAETSILKLASNHPNVVTLVDVVMRPSGRGRQDHLILMEYCSGGHAFGLIQRMKREVSTHTGMR